MTHNLEREKSFLKEFARTMIPSLGYGISASLVGYPFDTLKTIIQTLPQKQSTLKTFNDLGQTLTSKLSKVYKGFWTNSIGAVFYRMLSISTYEASFTYLTKTQELN